MKKPPSGGFFVCRKSEGQAAGRSRPVAVAQGLAANGCFAVRKRKSAQDPRRSASPSPRTRRPPNLACAPR